MLRVVLAGLRAHRVRLAMSAMAIVLGVGFVAGTLIFSDTAKAAFFAQFARQAAGVDAAVSPQRQAEGKGAGALVPAPVYDRLRSVGGAASVEGRMAAPVTLLARSGRPITDGESAGVGVDIPADPRFQVTTTVSGRLPRGPGEAVLDRDTAAREGLRAGGGVTVLGRGGARTPLRLVGIVDFGVRKDLGTGSVLGLRAADLTALTGVSGYTRVDLAAAPGVSEQALTDRARSAAGPAYTVVTGERLAHDLADDVVHNIDSILLGLLMFAFVAVVVAALVIYNTFAILVAQRIRELALLRCVGATRRQILGAVLLEALAVAGAASIVGAAAGLGIAAALRAVFAAIGTAPPSGPLVVSGGGLALAAGLGVVATVLSALLPALSATRVTPVTALGAVPEGRVGSVTARAVRTVAALVAAAAGLGLAVAGLDRGRPGLYFEAAGGTVFFLGVLVAGPLLVGPLTRVIGWPGLLAGVPGRLASANARRAPGRSATTTMALTIGVGLMTLFSVVAASAQTFAAAQIDKHYPVDYLVQALRTGDGADQPGVPPAVAAGLRALPELSSVAELRKHTPRSAGATGGVVAVDPAGYAAAYRPETLSGSLDRVRDGSGVAAVATELRKRVGDTVTVDGRRLRVVAVFRGNLAGEQIVVSWADFARYYGPGDDDMVLVIARHGVGAGASRAALDRALADRPLVRVTAVASYKEQLSSAVDTVLALFGGLLGIAMIIALFGIANTLSLSVIERTRESALLRALGLTRRQLRLMLSAEALIMGIMGGTVGVAVGAGFGWTVSQTFMRPRGGGEVTYPIGQIALYLAIAAAAALLASVLPARRAARVPPAQALTA
jgi:putative ABC transport system permease protein